MIAAALGIWPVIDRLIVRFEDRPHDLIGLIIIVAILGRLVEKHQAQSLITLKVIIQSSR